MTRARAQIGDVVQCWKWVLDTEYVAEGVVTDISDNGYVKVNGDWWPTDNNALHQCQIYNGPRRQEIIDAHRLLHGPT